MHTTHGLQWNRKALKVPPPPSPGACLRRTAFSSASSSVPPPPLPRGLFEAHRLLFSFLICTAIQRDAQLVSAPAWDFLLRGAPATPAAAATPGSGAERGGSAASARGGTAPHSAASERGAASAPQRPLTPQLAAWMGSATWSTLKALDRAVPELAGLALAVSEQV